MTDVTMTEKIEIEEDDISPPSRWRIWQLMLLRDKKAFSGLIILTIFVVIAVFAPLIAPYDPNDMEYEMIESPSWQHPLGTDDLGRDLLTRIMYGTRISLFIGIVTVAVALVIGGFLGLIGGYYGGWLDYIIMRYIDLQWSFPNIIIIVYLVAVFERGIFWLMVAITLAYIDDFARIVRSMVLTLKEQEYVSAARALGFSDMRIMLRHILPNATAPIIVQATVSIALAILAEAALSFLGLGVESITPTWGLILAEGRGFITRAWWLGLFPGLAIMLTVLSVNFLGDTLRDFLDVREAKYFF